MKKIILITLAGILSCFGVAQTTATDFNVNDCSGINHHLFAELDAGKVVVITLVMPCTSCIAPSVSAYNEVLNYATTYPGRVVFYLSDDLGTASCSSITSWGTANGITGVPVFCNTAVKQSDYGTAAMPKIVVLGGPAHTVLFNQNNGLNVTNFNAAINLGLTAGIFENSKSDFKLSVFPNPSTTSKTTINYTLKEGSDVTVDIYNTIGEKVKTIALEKQAEGKHESILDFETLTNGIYFMKLNAGDSSQVLKFSVSH
ncbi:MAG: T9SS type A sorting domain-containing protein [Bacteroidetes bacterium]|nr:T9SS type A sorting domain-containing protein [Bacteroidota bacterium]